MNKMVALSKIIKVCMSRYKRIYTVNIVSWIDVYELIRNHVYRILSEEFNFSTFVSVGFTVDLTMKKVKFNTKQRIMKIEKRKLFFLTKCWFGRNVGQDVSQQRQVILSLLIAPFRTVPNRARYGVCNLHISFILLRCKQLFYNDMLIFIFHY